MLSSHVGDKKRLARQGGLQGFELRAWALEFGVCGGLGFRVRVRAWEGVVGRAVLVICRLGLRVS